MKRGVFLAMILPKCTCDKIPYERELKFQICKRIFDGEITVEEASVECGATIATIKKWVKLYTIDPISAAEESAAFAI